MGGESKPHSEEASVTFASGNALTASPPDLRLLHYNDVYHLDPSSAEPVGGIARFMTVCKEYAEDSRFNGQPDLVTLFSGDVFNPSLESTVTKGAHMVPVLNAIGTDCACVGNHDFDFGVGQFAHLTSECNFPWLLANVLDPALGKDVPLGNAKPTHMYTSSNGIKIGLIGLGEREWLATINSLPPNIIYKSASETAKELVPKLREEGAEIVICLSHMREPNDNKLAEKTEGLLDIILGGHDHFYAHSLINGTHVLRSGSDFKQLSYIEARRKDDGRWDFDIWRRDIVSSIPEHPPTLELVDDLTAKLKTSLTKPVGWTAAPLDSRFTTVRLGESNIANFVCDIMRQYHHADCAMMAAGTVRGDQIYPPGAIRVKDITNCFPFEDPVVLIRVKGQAILDALENGVSLVPALEGRFPQVSNIFFEFDPKKPSGSRIVSVKIGGEPLQLEKKYVMATRGYMARGKDGYTSLLVEPEGGSAEELVCEENGILISTMLRQYFMGLRTIGQWKNLSDNWKQVADECYAGADPKRVWDGPEAQKKTTAEPIETDEEPSKAWDDWLEKRTGINIRPVNDDVDVDDDGADTEDMSDKIDTEILLMRKFFSRWAKAAGVSASLCDTMQEEDIHVDWTRVIAPLVEGRIKMVQ